MKITHFKSAMFTGRSNFTGSSACAKFNEWTDSMIGKIEEICDVSLVALNDNTHAIFVTYLEKDEKNEIPDGPYKQ